VSKCSVRRPYEQSESSFSRFTFTAIDVPNCTAPLDHLRACTEIFNNATSRGLGTAGNWSASGNVKQSCYCIEPASVLEGPAMPGRFWARCRTKINPGFSRQGLGCGLASSPCKNSQQREGHGPKTGRSAVDEKNEGKFLCYHLEECLPANLVLITYEWHTAYLINMQSAILYFGPCIFLRWMKKPTNALILLYFSSQYSTTCFCILEYHHQGVNPAPAEIGAHCRGKQRWMEALYCGRWRGGQDITGFLYSIISWPSRRLPQYKASIHLCFPRHWAPISAGARLTPWWWHSSMPKHVGEYWELNVEGLRHLLGFFIHLRKVQLRFESTFMWWGG
jgi:hypothetical protein